MHRPGEPIHFELHSTDASTATEVPLYISGTSTVREIAEDEYLEIDDVDMVSAPGGDCHLFIGTDNTPAVGETVTRGTVAANGGIVRDYANARVGVKGGKLWVDAPAGVIDVQGTARIRKG